MLPDSFPPRQTVYGWFLRLRDECVFERINHHLVIKDRERAGRAASPSAAHHRQPERQDDRGRWRGGLRRRQKLKGRKRRALFNTDGRDLLVEPHRADVQDRDGGGPVLAASRHAFAFIEKVFADGGYAAERVADATAIAIKIVRKHPGRVGFSVQSRRWVVERFFACINRNRRLAKDFEATINSARASPYAASVMLLTRRIAANMSFEADTERAARPRLPRHSPLRRLRGALARSLATRRMSLWGGVDPTWSQSFLSCEEVAIWRVRSQRGE